VVSFLCNSETDETKAEIKEETKGSEEDGI
jgi:hypothetical protein